MTTRFNSDTTLIGYTANIEEDVRVIRDIERRAQDLQMKLWELERRWQARTGKLASRRCPGVSIMICYDFKDILC